MAGGARYVQKFKVGHWPPTQKLTPVPLKRPCCHDGHSRVLCKRLVSLRSTGSCQLAPDYRLPRLSPCRARSPAAILRLRSPILQASCFSTGSATYIPSPTSTSPHGTHRPGCPLPSSCSLAPRFFPGSR